MRKWLLLAALLGCIEPAQAQLTLTGVGPAGAAAAVVGAMTSPIMSAGSTAAPGTAAINYGRLSSGLTNSQWNAVATVEEDPFPVSGKIDNLTVWFPTQPGNTNASYDVGLVVNGTKSSLVCNVATASNSCSITLGGAGVAITAGNLVGWFTCPSGTATCTAGNAPTAQAAATQISATFTSTASQEGFIIGHNTNTSATVLNYGGFGGNVTVSATEVNVSSLMPAAGTIDRLYVVTGGTPGASSTYTLSVFKNGAIAPPGCTPGTNCLGCVVTAAATTCNDLGAHGFMVAQGDTISLQSCPSSSGNTLGCWDATGTVAPTARAVAASMRWVPSVANQAVLFDTFGTIPITTASAVRFQAVNGTGATGTTEVDLNGAPVVSGGMTLGNLTLASQAAPGGTSTRIVTLRAGVAGGSAQSDRAPTCTIPSASTTCTNGSTYGATSGQALNLGITNNGTQAAVTWFKAAMTATIP